jgi:hypothetical protein
LEGGVGGVVTGGVVTGGVVVGGVTVTGGVVVGGVAVGGVTVVEPALFVVVVVVLVEVDPCLPVTLATLGGAWCW